MEPSVGAWSSLGYPCGPIPPLPNPLYIIPLMWGDIEVLGAYVN